MSPLGFQLQPTRPRLFSRTTDCNDFSASCRHAHFGQPPVPPAMAFIVFRYDPGRVGVVSRWAWWGLVSGAWYLGFHE
jgi:hypothetical protein